PDFQDVFQEFGLTLPRITTLFISLAGAPESLFAMAFVTLAALLALTGVVVGACYLCDFDVLRPIFDRLAFSRHRASVLRLLAAAIEQGKPMAAAVTQLTSGWSAYPSRLVRRRLASAGAEREAGQPWPEALRQHSLVSANDAA